MKSRARERARKKRILTVAAAYLGIAVLAGGIFALALREYGRNHADEDDSNGNEVIGISSVTASDQSLKQSLETSPEPVLAPTATPLPTATLTPTPVPEPSSQYLENLSGYDAGEVIDSGRIDESNLNLYFTSVSIEKNDDVYNRIIGKSFVDNDDIALSELRYIKLLHVNFNGECQVGELIVNKSVSDDVISIFETLFEDRYEIEKMHLIDDYWTGDASCSYYNSIDHNNTSAFCYRAATGSSHLSKHALGLAIDINPQQNPYVTIADDGTVRYSHDNAAEYSEDRSLPHAITDSDGAYRLFTEHGWTWGGSWSSPKDYQHFQISG